MAVAQATRDALGEGQALLDTLRNHADPARARPMAAYMRDQFAFWGVATPQRRALSASLVRAPHDAQAVLALSEWLWQQPERECQYIACDLLRHHAKTLSPEHLPQLLDWVARGHWWDTVDALVPTVGHIVRHHRDDPRALATIEAALVHPDFWLRRVAVLHQLGWRLDTDAPRLWRHALTLAPESAFFIRKAIGWALRDYARWAPDAVRAFLRDHGAALSPLSQREASKHL